MLVRQIFQSKKDGKNIFMILKKKRFQIDHYIKR